MVVDPPPNGKYKKGDLPNGVECPELIEGQHAVYILRCSDATYYVGCTSNVLQRLREHHTGKAALWTAIRRPIVLVYVEVHDTLLGARRRESQIKGWARVKKKKLIRGEWEKFLARRGSSVVEQRSEEPRVASSILAPGTRTEKPAWFLFSVILAALCAGLFSGFL